MNSAALKVTSLAVLAAATALILALAVFATPARAGSAGIFDASSFTTTDGRAIYEHICRACHMADAGGAVGAGHYPALAKNPALISREYMVLTILMGRRNMPAFGVKHAIGFGGPPLALSDAQVAAVVNYVRSNFGNHYKDATSAAEVNKLDSALH
jgi:mono/diheme cytochrome c family protein